MSSSFHPWIVYLLKKPLYFFFKIFINSLNHILMTNMGMTLGTHFFCVSSQVRTMGKESAPFHSRGS